MSDQMVARSMSHIVNAGVSTMGLTSCRILTALLVTTVYAAIVLSIGPVFAQQTDEPLSYTGHGAFFDRTGRQIVPTEKFVRDALAWYRADLLAKASPEKRSEFEALDKREIEGLKLEGQTQLLWNAMALRQLLASDKNFEDDWRTKSKISALEYALQWKLPDKDDITIPQYDEPLKFDPSLVEKFKKFGFGGNIQVLSATINNGQGYINECANNGVPIPPPIGQLDPAGLTGWKSQGTIPQNEQFIIGTKAEVMTYHSTSPEGLCVALPRQSSGTTGPIGLDGVICLGKNASPITGKSTTCFWDNRWIDPADGVQKQFQFTPADYPIPIGVPTTTGGKYMGGGIDISNETACTDCHAGQNPYIIHPTNVLGTLSSLGLPTFGVTRYDPIVVAAWPQNDKSLSNNYVPGACMGCHTGGFGGRLPHVSDALPGYCFTILRQAVQFGLPHTMPLGNPGGAAGDADLKTLINLANLDDADSFCKMAPTSGPADRGDPHLTTTNGVHFDFQSAGEFTALRDEDAAFELQTRQTPILTNFTPGVNPYTGLASCVSLNTAVAVRVGKHRLTYQASLNERPDPEGMQLRLDGKRTRLSAKGQDLGNGAVVKSAAGSDGIDIALADGTRIIVTPNWWASQGYWYLNVEVLNSPAVSGTMGHIAPAEWLPRGPHGLNFGSKPAAQHDRFVVLNQKFANAWRVTPQTSLFDYAQGRGTDNFTDLSWPSEKLNCSESSVPGPTVKEQFPRERAMELCKGIRDKGATEECIFDVMFTGEPGFAKLYAQSIQLRINATNGN
jgi:hypothetical protein